MKKQRTDGQETRQRLLAAASEVFAEKGFWETTNADICERAKANTAAVNYHFSSKEDLYVEAWKYSFGRSVSTYPPDGGVAPESPAQERLYGKILSFMQRIADPTTHDLEIIHKEMASPTGLLTDTIQKAIEPLDQSFKSIIRELLGDNVSRQDVCFCQMSIMGQCFGPMLHLRRARVSPETPRPVGLNLEFGVKELANHVTRFSLAGMRGIREEAEKKRKGSKSEQRSRMTRNRSSS
jgi:AcrR family transcriptional regulator